MFSEEDFKLPLEKELRLKVVLNEIKECKDVEALQENLCACAESLMKYQHLLGKAVEINLRGFLDEMLDTMGIEDTTK